MSTQHQELVKQYQQKLKDNREELDFGDGQIGNKGAKALAAVLPTSSLTTLDLAHNYIGDEGAKALANALSTSSLTTLNLEYNYIEDEGAKTLADALPTSSLTTLNLWGNHIGDEGAKALADTLSTSSLITLNLGFNSIKDEGIKALAKTLPKSSLTTLNLWRNHIGDESSQHLKKAVFTPGCRICKTGLSEIDETLKPRNKKLLIAASKLLLGRHVTESPLNKLANDKKITLFFTIKDTQIKCRNLIMQFFLKKSSDNKNTISTLLPVPELLHYVLSFVFPVLPGQDISKSWEMAEEKLAAITPNTTELKKNLAI